MDEKKNLLAALPRGLGQKFSGKAQDWPAFKKTFESIRKSVDPSLAVKHMIALIADPALQKRLQIYTSGEAIIKELDKDLGHSFLTCQVIVNEISRKEKAKTKKQGRNENHPTRIGQIDQTLHEIFFEGNLFRGK